MEMKRSKLTQKEHKMLNVNTYKKNLNVNQRADLRTVYMSVHIIVYNCHT